MIPTVVSSPARADHYTRGRSAPIRAVIIHATGGTNSLDWLRWSSSPPVSCHALVTKAGLIHRIVEDTSTAWHAGFGKLGVTGLAGLNPNAFSLGLELENLNNGQDPYTEAQLEATAWQLATWHRLHGWLYWLRHGDVDTRKWDPAGLNMASMVRRFCGALSRM